ncbi:MAG: hypothetical protein CM15mP74_24430 [Halieaceae bacterium]|nr:MAG: hypothetical protein CM15mP74_24430 [Halieaceae bacterium]
MLREANRNRLIARLGIGVQDAIGISMGSKQLRDHRGDIHGPARCSAAEDALNVAPQNIHHGLVQGAPVVNLRAQ